MCASCLSAARKPPFRASWLWKGPNGITYALCFGCYFGWLRWGWSDLLTEARRA